MRPTIRTPTRSPDDFEHLGKAFEGLAGALHDGQPVEREDLQAACSLAHDLWPVRGGGRDLREEEFESHRMACRNAIPDAVQGDYRAWARLARACHHVGIALRWKGREIAAQGRDAPWREWPAAHETRAGIRRLDHRYARYAMNPVLLPL